MSRVNHAVDSSVIPTFYRLWLPSLVGLLAMSTASIVDGLFIGNLVGATALAAVNLIIPFFGILFGFSLMLGMGGSVRAGKYIGEGNDKAASSVFSKTLLSVFGIAGFITLLSYLFESQLLRALGGNDEVLPLMTTYFRISMGFIWFELLTVVMYFFVRVDGYPAFAATSLVIGSVINIALDYVFIAKFNWGVAGAAWATGFSQSLPGVILCFYFFFKQRHLSFSWYQTQLGDLVKSAFNGLSEFVNEISAAITGLLLNWLFMLRFGVDGVAAVTVLNYLLMIGVMIVFSIGDAATVFVSQNYGAQQVHRIRRYLLVSVVNVLAIALIFISLILWKADLLVLAFLSNEDQSVANLATELLRYIWPVFAVNGLTMVVTSYLTGLHLPVPSAVIALSRGLVFPVLLLLAFYNVWPAADFIVALPLAEVITFIISLFFLWFYFPNTRLVQKLSSL